MVTMNNTAYFKHTLTGVVGEYPMHYAELFPDVLIPCGQDSECIDCGLKDEPAPVPVLAPKPVAPVARRRPNTEEDA